MESDHRVPHHLLGDPSLPALEGVQLRDEPQQVSQDEIPGQQQGQEGRGGLPRSPLLQGGPEGPQQCVHLGRAQVPAGQQPVQLQHVVPQERQELPGAAVAELLQLAQEVGGLVAAPRLGSRPAVVRGIPVPIGARRPPPLWAAGLGAG